MNITKSPSQLADIGRLWLEDSSLEKWFPITAEQFKARTDALVRFADAFEQLLQTNGATHYFDVSETFDGAAWLCGGIGKPYLEACRILGREPVEQMGGARKLESEAQP